MASSEHFTKAELACHHCGVDACTPGLVEALEKFRAITGKPVIVNDAYRCPIHNKEVGGKPDSQHLLGNAADIRVVGLQAHELEAVANQVAQIHGIGRADVQNYLHVDVRPSIARWCYNVAGQTVTYFPFGHSYRCQHCLSVTPSTQWTGEGDICPKCGKSFSDE